MTATKITRKRMMLEMSVKYVFTAALFFGIYSPYSIDAISRIKLEMQESLISFMGFLMAAAIIGAFELSYLRTNLDDRLQRYLAHLTKFTLYSSILLLTQISVIAILVADQSITVAMVMASSPIMIALVFYDFWDAFRAMDKQVE